MSDKESHVTKSDLTILGGVNRTDDLPSNHQVRFTPNHLYDLPQIAREDLPLKSPSTIYPPSNRPILSKISNAHNIMLCFTKVFSAKDQKGTNLSGLLDGPGISRCSMV